VRRSFPSRPRYNLRACCWRSPRFNGARSSFAEARSAASRVFCWRASSESRNWRIACKARLGKRSFVALCRQTRHLRPQNFGRRPQVTHIPSTIRTARCSFARADITLRCFLHLLRPGAGDAPQLPYPQSPRCLRSAYFACLRLRVAEELVSVMRT